jgi:Protein of unknown function (DUF3499)
MRTCAKKPCGARPEATVALRYEEKVVVLTDLLPAPDPGLMDLCRGHSDRLKVMVGWSIRDQRSAVTDLGVR